MEQMTAWHNPPLEAVYPIIYLDCIVVKVYQNQQVRNKAGRAAPGIDPKGHKRILGPWIAGLRLPLLAGLCRAAA